MLKEGFFREIIDFCIPSSCLICQEIVQQSELAGTICFSCYHKIKWLTPPRCIQCCEKFEYDMLSNEKCLNCLAHQWFFKRIISCTAYDEHSARIAMQLKYKGIGKKYIAQCITKTLHICFPNFQKEIDYIIPVPLHWKRWLKRGFNQSELVAKALSKKIKKPLIPDLLLRIKNTHSQGGLTLQERRDNVKSAFVVNPKFKYLEQFQCRHILLIDDVITTGSTVDSCAKALVKSLKAQVSVATWSKRLYNSNPMH